MKIIWTSEKKTILICASTIAPSNVISLRLFDINILSLVNLVIQKQILQNLSNSLFSTAPSTASSQVTPSTSSPATDNDIGDFFFFDLNIAKTLNSFSERNGRWKPHSLLKQGTEISSNFNRKPHISFNMVIDQLPPQQSIKNHCCDIQYFVSSVEITNIQSNNTCQL